MGRQIILLEDLIDVFVGELGHVLEEKAPLGHGKPPVYPAKGLFLYWLFIYLSLADAQRRLVQTLTQHLASDSQPNIETRKGTKKVRRRMKKPTSIHQALASFIFS